MFRSHSSRSLLFASAVVLAVAAWKLPADVETESIVRAADPAAEAAPGPGGVDTEASRAYVLVDKRRLGHKHGVEGRIKEGTIHLGATQDAGKIVFDMSTFVADTDAARKYVGLEDSIKKSEQDEVTATMTGKSTLDVKAHPTATFDIKSATLLTAKSTDGDPQYQLDGEFSLRGKKNALKVVAEVEEEKDGKVRLVGNFTIKQTDYGITPYSAVGGLVAVADPLKIWGDVWVVKE
jgi:polyisoprenoid-binding protein YceI